MRAEIWRSPRGTRVLVAIGSETRSISVNDARQWRAELTRCLAELEPGAGATPPLWTADGAPTAALRQRRARRALRHHVVPAGAAGRWDEMVAAPCASCGTVSERIFVVHDGREVASGHLCSRCLDTALAEVSELRRQFNALLEAGVDRAEASRIMIEIVDGCGARA